MPILVGTDGARKMSKSLGNQIGVTDAPQEMYGKTMAIPDEAIGEYYRLLLGDARRGAPAGCAAPATAAPTAARPRRQARAGARARGVAALATQDAGRASAHSSACSSQHEAPEEIDEASFAGEARTVHLPALIARSSASRARRRGG